MNPPNTYEKTYQSHEIDTKKNSGPTKYLREKYLNPENTHKKYLDLQNTNEKSILTHKIRTRKNFGRTKYPRENNLDP